MPKKSKKINLEKEIMSKVISGKIKMKPKIYFIFGSILTIVSLIFLFSISVFFTNIFFFIFKKRGQICQWQIQNLLNNFPWWILLISILGIFLGILIIKKNNFSYKKNFIFITSIFIVSIIISAFIINYLNFNNFFSRQKPMRRFYQRLELREKHFFNNRNHRFRF
jgi:uncharacterized membrane protein YozB (DUF420 family)